MNKIIKWVSMLILLYPMFLLGQTMIGFPLKSEIPDGNECAAILIDNKMLVDDYAPDGKCVIAHGDKGFLEVASVILSEDSATPKTKIQFYIAVQNEKYGTMYMLTENPVKSYDLSTLLQSLTSGDNLIIITADKKFSLPHHQVRVLGKC